MRQSVMDTFLRLGLPQPVAAAFAALGFTRPTPSQEKAVPLLLAGKDVFIQSETGTGKTFAYLAPGLVLASGADFARGPRLLVVCPTQELAVQVSGQAERLAAAAGIPLPVLTLLGGSPLSRQETSLKRKPALVVGTAGRVADLIRMGALKTGNLRLAVLDEADRLFTPETVDSATAIMEALPAACTRALVSATLGERTRRLAAPHLRNPEATAPEDEGVLSALIEHWAFHVDHRKRLDFIRRIDAAIHPARCLVFASRTDRAVQAVDRMAADGLSADSILARQDKEHRRVALERFAAGKLRYLVTSDLGARGLDIPGITHIISLDLPEEHTVYTHRAGRTGRAGAEGISIVLADGVELQRASRIAVRGGFAFRCKVLEDGEVLEPTVEEFFARVEAVEAEKADYRARRKSGEMGKTQVPAREAGQRDAGRRDSGQREDGRRDGKRRA